MLFRDVSVGELFFAGDVGEFLRKISHSVCVVCSEDGVTHDPEDPIVFQFPEDHPVEEIEE